MNYHRSGGLNKFILSVLEAIIQVQDVTSLLRTRLVAVEGRRDKEPLLACFLPASDGCWQSVVFLGRGLFYFSL